MAATFENYDGCLMLGVYCQYFYDIQKVLNFDDIHPEDGIETYPHITLLYGINRNTPEDFIFNFANSIPKLQFTSSKVDYFSNENFDVLKFSIDLDENLQNYRRRAVNIFDNKQTYPTFEPHCTISYLLPKTAKKYAMDLSPIVFDLVNVKYSKHDKSGFTILK
jgi:hypothetical protein